MSVKQQPHQAHQIRVLPMQQQSIDIKVPPSRVVTERPGDPDFMASLARGLAVIRAFDEQTRLLSISQISVRTGLARAVVRRCLYTLETLGYVLGRERRLQSRAQDLVAGRCLSELYAADRPRAAGPR